MSKLFLQISRWMFALCLLPVTVFSQINGKITDASGNPVEGAIVSIKGTFLHSTSDKDGNFSIASEGDSLTITHISFQPVIYSTNDKLENIKLNRRTYLSEEVTINASRADDKSAIAYNVLTKEDIEKINDGKDFPFLLNTLPSVVVTSDAGTGVGYTGIRVRGSDATRVNVTINGIPINDAESQQLYWVDLPDIASSVESVQLQRGLGNSTSGAGAFGASLNVLTNQLSTQPYATLSSSAGSFNTFKNTVMFGSGLISNRFAVEGRLSKITSDGYIDRATSDLKSLYLNAGYYGEKNSLRFVTFSGVEKTYQAWYGVPEDSLETNRTYNPAGQYYDANGNPLYYENQTDNYQQDYYQLLYSHEFNDHLILNSALHYTYGRGYYEEYKQDATYADYSLGDPNDTINTSGDLIRRKWLSNDFAGANISVEYTTSQLKLQGGISGTYFDGDHFGEVIAAEMMPLLDYPHEYYNDNAYKTDISAFIKTVYSVNTKTDITVDLQQRHIEYSYLGYDVNLNPLRITSTLDFFNPKIGINYYIKPTTQIYVYGGIGHKEPVRDDYINAIPVEKLSPEMMVDIELGIKGRSKNCMYGLNLYYMDYDNQLILTGAINDVGEPIRQNVKESYRAGIEAEGEYKFMANYYVKGNVTYSMNEIKRYFEHIYNWDDGSLILNDYSNTPISFSPSVTGYAAIGTNLYKAFNAELSGKYIGKQFLDNTGNDSRSIDPYFVSNVRLAYTFTPKKIKEITLQFSVFNLFDKKYSSNGYTYGGIINDVRQDYNYYFPQAGISFNAGLLIKL